MLPVLEMAVQMKQSARYDDLLTVHSMIHTMPTARLRIDYELLCHDKLLVTGHTVHAFISAASKPPVRPPKEFLLLLEESMGVDVV